MTLLTETITNHRNSTDIDLDPPMIAAFIPVNPGDVIWNCSVSPNDRYAAGFNNARSGDGPMLWVADLDSLNTIYNINIGTMVFDSEFLPSVTRVESLNAAVDDIGSVWTVDGDGSGRVVELLIDAPEVPQYRFTLDSGGGGDSYSLRYVRPFTMPDDTIRVLFVKGSATEEVHGWHLWDNAAETYAHDVVTWNPTCAFQDELGDIWICGVDYDLPQASTTDITTAHFKRLTNITGTSPYTSPIDFTGLPDIDDPFTDPIDRTALWGGIANGYFVGGWLEATVLQDSAATPMTGRCDYLLKLNLSDNTDKTFTNIGLTASPGLQWAMPSGSIPPDQAAIALTYSDIAERRFGLFSTTDHSITNSYALEDWEAENPEALSGSALDDDVAYVGQYLYTRQAFIAQSSGYDFFDSSSSLQQYGKLWIYYTGEEAPVDEDSDEGLTLRVWTYSLDGHDFYVLRLGPSETLVYDLTTQQWSSWKSPSRNNWRAHIGSNWLGMSTDTFNRGFGSDVVAGDDVTGVLWVLDPNTGLDDTTTTGSLPFTRMVIGGVSLSGRDTVPCGAVELTASVGHPALIGATITLRTSDDKGHTYNNHGNVTATAGSYDQVIEWRALGLIKAPGRLFELSDNGAAVRINSLDMR